MTTMQTTRRTARLTPSAAMSTTLYPSPPGPRAPPVGVKGHGRNWSRLNLKQKPIELGLGVVDCAV